MGSGMKQAQWDRVENKAMTEQIRLTDEALVERDALSVEARKAALALSEAEDEAVRLSDALQTEITRGPIIQMVETEDCPAVAVVDVARHYRLFNCGIGNSCQALLSPRIPD